MYPISGRVPLPPRWRRDESGDVLTGIVAARLTQGIAPLEAVAAPAWLHGAAAVEFGLGSVAEDLPIALPRVLQKLCLSVPVGGPDRKSPVE